MVEEDDLGMGELEADGAIDVSDPDEFMALEREMVVAEVEVVPYKEMVAFFFDARSKLYDVRHILVPAPTSSRSSSYQFYRPGAKHPTRLRLARRNGSSAKGRSPRRSRAGANK